MKKFMFRMIIILILLLTTSCNSGKDTTTLKNGTYVLEHTGEDKGLFPRVTVTGDDISFDYDSLSSYLPVGNYSIKDNVLSMKTNDGIYKYVFKVEGDKLVFQESESSPVKLTDDRIGIKVTDNTVFKLEVN